MKLALDCIAGLLDRSASDDRSFPPTLLFEEGWMLRLVLNWFSTNETDGHDLSFDEDAEWFSEAHLPSTFLPRKRGDKHSEGYTHADGAIGHFRIGSTGQADLSLLQNATQFKVVEAKMFSKLSRGTTHAPRYNQAARNVGCIAEILRLADREPSEMRSIGFYVLAPREQIEQGVFKRQMTHSSIEETVKERVDNYDKPKTDWYDTWFLPTLRHIDLKCISWEDVAEYILSRDPTFGESLSEFYSHCLRFNRPQGAVTHR